MGLEPLSARVLEGKAVNRPGIFLVGDAGGAAWDEYLRGNPDSSAYHLFGWRDVVRRTYGHATYYLACQDGGAAADAGGCGDRKLAAISGILPLVHMKHPIFGNSLVSMPFLDGPGLLADSCDVQNELIGAALRLGRELGATTVELRQECASACLDGMGAGTADPQAATEVPNAKVRMLLALPASGKLLMAGFKSKLRSQIAKPIKEGLVVRSGGAELLDDFYQVFLVNMRDLGSPVHSIALMRNVLGVFPERSRVFVAYKAEEPVAASVVVGFNGVLRNPWASSLRKHSGLSPNMLLYLRMLEYACDQGYGTFDFGRSTPGEGTYRFKEQWGAQPAPLHWRRFHLDGRSTPEAGARERFSRAATVWQKLPLSVTRFLGPRIRKHISL